MLPCSALHNGQVFAEVHVDDGVVAFFALDDRTWNLGDTSQLCVLVDPQHDITSDIRRYA